MDTQRERERERGGGGGGDALVEELTRGRMVIIRTHEGREENGTRRRDKTARRTLVG